MIITDLYLKLFGRSGTTKGSDIDMAEHGRVGGNSTKQGFKFTQDTELAVVIQSSGTDTYIAEAPVGSLNTDAVWIAFKVDSTGTITYANGSESYNNAADNLSSLIYS